MRQIKPPNPTPADALRDQLMRQIRQPGGDPSLLLDLLADCVEKKMWERQGVAFPTFVTAEYDQGGIHWTIPNLRAILTLKHRYEDQDRKIAARMKTMRQTVDRLLIKPAERKSKKNRAKGKSTEASTVHELKSAINAADASRSRSHGSSRSETLDRLMRDFPELAERVLQNEISANKAAIMAGLRQRSIQFYPDDVERTATVLRRHMNAESLAQLVQILIGSERSK